MNQVKQIYKVLLKKYGPQGWWPLLDVKGTNPTKTGSIQGYHPNDYSYPKTKLQQWEIIVGALLTQNTSWPQVEKSLINLKKQNLLNYKITNNDLEKIKECIKPSGYFNQKSERLISLAQWYQELKHTPTRDELLSQKGIGPETADSILLYAFKELQFVIDSYTKRIMKNLELIPNDAKYDEVKNLFESNFEKDFKLFQEYHALLVEHAKNYYTKKKSDSLLNVILK
ncbi:endonuclease III domain-containing protein [Candidatus Woesearchaeota archaeon]|nr:endonuclease III domain-containing protein [Candidatus Woesearchaeota archaeon]